MSSLRDRLQYLFRSDTRLDVLAAMYNDGPLDRYELEDKLGVSRRTVTRTIDGLANRGLVVETPDGYTLSTYGQVLVKTYRAHYSRLSTVDRLRPFFRNVDISTLDLQIEAFNDAELITPDKERPYALFDRILALRDSATQLREVWPIAAYQPAKQAADLVTADDLRYEAIVGTEVHQTAREQSDYRDHYEQLVTTADIYLYEDSLQLFVSIAADDVLLGTVDSVTGDWQAMVSSSNPTVRSWANNWFDQLCAKSQQL